MRLGPKRALQRDFMRTAGCRIGADGQKKSYLPPLRHFTIFFASKSNLKLILIPYSDREGDWMQWCPPIHVGLATFFKQPLNPCSSKMNGGR